VNHTDIDSDLESALSRWSKSLVIIHRTNDAATTTATPTFATSSTPNNNNTSQLESELLKLINSNNMIQLSTNSSTTTTSQSQKNPPVAAEQQQCLQRIACEGVFSSFPKIILRTVMLPPLIDINPNKPQPKMEDEENEEELEEQIMSRSKTMIRFKNAKNKGTISGLNKRKNLAKYALGKIRPQEKLATKQKQKQNQKQTGLVNDSLNPPKDLCSGWFLPRPPQNRTTTRPTPKVKIINSTMSSNTNETEQYEPVTKMETTTVGPNPCSRYKCSFMS
jgi:hypothetical protein